MPENKAIQWPDTWSDERMKAFIEKQAAKPTCLIGWSMIAQLAKQAQQSQISTQKTS
jgi:hypothetical protein